MKASERPLDFEPWCISENCYYNLFHMISIFPIMKEHEGQAKFTGCLQVKSASHGLCSQWMSMAMMVSCGPISMP